MVVAIRRVIIHIAVIVPQRTHRHLYRHGDGHVNAHWDGYTDKLGHGALQHGVRKAIQHLHRQPLARRRLGIALRNARDSKHATGCQ